MTEVEKGNLSAIISTVVWAFFPVVTVILYQVFPSMLTVTLMTAIAALFFLILVLVRKNFTELKNVQLLKYVACIALFNIIGYYGLFFFGLSKTTPGNASIVAVAEVLTSFLFFNIWKKEKMSSPHMLGVALMILGVAIVLVPNGRGIHSGDLIILLATCCAPFGNFFQQKARKIAKPENILFLRNAFAAVFFFILIRVLHIVPIAPLTPVVVGLLLINAVVIFGASKIFFLEAIHRISVTNVIALGSFAPFLTLLFSWFFLGQVPILLQFSALLPLTIGTLLLTDQFPLKKV